MNDAITRLMFRFGPRIYGWAVGAGPEVPLRREFASFAAANGAAGSLLDVGCGPAFMAEDASGRYRRYTGCDRSVPMLRYARRFLAQRRLSAPLLAASAFELPFPGASFDLVLACDVVYLLPDPVRALAEMARVARPGGTVATLDPSTEMTPRNARVWCRTAGQGPVHTFRIVLWAAAAVRYRRYTEESRAAEFVAAGLPAPEMRRELGGMVLFAKVSPTA